MMQKNYTAFAGQNLVRLTTLSDGIFAIVLTLLILDLRVPIMDVLHDTQPLWADGAVQSEQQLLNALVPLAPRFLAYFMSFLTLGIFWVAQQTQHNFFNHTDRTLTWLHLGFLLAVSLMPFSTALLAEHITYRLALIIYWFNLILLGLMLYLSWHYAERAQLTADEVNDDISRAIKRRIVVYQVLYALAAALCVISVYLSIFFLIVFQLSSVIAPRFTQRISR